MILETISVGSYETNCYICAAARGGAAVVIDPGDDAVRIMRRVRDLTLDVASIVLTHGHADHSGAVKELKEATGAEIAVHAADADLLGNDLAAVMLGLTPSRLRPDRLLEGGEKVAAGDLVLAVLHTPGHTRGSICLLGDDLIFTGDTLFQAGIGRTDLPGGNYAEITRSIQTGLMPLPDDTMVYPGHGLPTTIGTERRYNPFL